MAHPPTYCSLPHHIYRPRRVHYGFPVKIVFMLATLERIDPYSDDIDLLVELVCHLRQRQRWVWQDGDDPAPALRQLSQLPK